METETKQSDCLVCNPDSNNPHFICEGCKERGYDFRYCARCAAEMVLTEAQYDKIQQLCFACDDEYGE